MIKPSPRAIYAGPGDFPQPIIQPVKETGWFFWRRSWVKLIEDYVILWPRNGERYRVVIKAGVGKDAIVWDMATTWLADSIGFKRDGYATGPSLAHDLAYGYDFQFIRGVFELHKYNETARRWEMAEETCLPRWEFDDLLGDSYTWGSGKKFKGNLFDWTVRYIPINWGKQKHKCRLNRKKD